jgi:secreted trypsin-like serine protease
VLALAATAPATPAIINPDSDTRSVPYQVALLDNSMRPYEDQYCGGTIVDASHIVTAAHCVSYAGDVVPPNAIQVAAGIANLAAPEATYQRRTLSQIDRHPDSRNLEFDAAVLTLAEPLVLNDAVRPLALPAANANDVGAPALLSGWGDTDPSRYYATHPASLQHVVIDVLADSACSAYGADYFASMMLCAGRNDSGAVKGECQGDSGGPLARLDGAGHAVALVGIASWVYDCGDATHPSIFVRVAAPAIRDFILAHSNASVSTPPPPTTPPGSGTGGTPKPPAGGSSGAQKPPAGQAGGVAVDGVSPASVAAAETVAESANRISRGHCTRSRCTLTVRATGRSAVTLTLVRLTGCAHGAPGTACRRARHLTLTELDPGVFRIVLHRLAPARYRASAAGAAGLVFRVKPR